MKDHFRPLVALDIETLTLGQKSIDFVNSNLTIKVGHLKDPEKINAKRKEAELKANSKHALSWHLSRVVCIGLVDVYGSGCLNNLHHQSVKYGPSSGEKIITAYEDDESRALRLLHDALNGCYVIGKNSRAFDFPYLVGRYLANNIPLPMALKEKRRMYDIDDFFGGAMLGQRASLDSYAFGLGMEQKSFHGSQVESLYKEGRFDELEDYCLNDAKIVAEMARRYWGKSRRAAHEGGLA